MTDFWLSSHRMTVWVRTAYSDKIIDSAPVVRKFRGQYLNNLIGWMKRQGGFRMGVLNETNN